MALHDAELTIDILAQKLDALIGERNTLRKEVKRKSFGSLEQEKAFVYAYQSRIIDSALSAMKVDKLEHILIECRSC